jgi:hypothetical protein
MPARPFRLSFSHALVLGLCLSAALACQDDDVTYQGSADQGSAASDLTADETAVYECSPLASSCPAEVPSYAGEIAGIIERHCGNCHLENNLGGPWPFTRWQDVYDWNGSLRVTLEQCLMPPPDTDAPLSETDRVKLQSWLACGAPNN